MPFTNASTQSGMLGRRRTYTYAHTQSLVNRKYSRALRALVDIQDFLYPGGRRPLPRARRRPFRLRSRQLPSDVDEGYDSDETMHHKRKHHILATRVVRRLLRNSWAKKTRRRLLYFLCWVLKARAKPLAAKALMTEEIMNIAEYVGRPFLYREWQSWRVQRRSKVYRLRK